MEKLLLKFSLTRRKERAMCDRCKKYSEKNTKILIDLDQTLIPNKLTRLEMNLCEKCSYEVIPEIRKILWPTRY